MKNALVVGSSETSDGVALGFAWTEKTGMVVLAPPVRGRSFASAVNDKGQIIGWADDVSGYVPHAMLWTIHSDGAATTEINVQGD